MTTAAWDNNDFHIHFDWLVFAFTAAVTLLTGLLFGLAPALSAARSEVTHGLKERANHDAASQGNGRKSAGWLPDRTLYAAGDWRRAVSAHACRFEPVPVGFRTDHLLLSEIDPPANRYPAGKDIQMHQRLEQALAGFPVLNRWRRPWIRISPTTPRPQTFFPKVSPTTKKSARKKTTTPSGFASSRRWASPSSPAALSACRIRRLQCPLESSTRAWREPVFPDKILSAKGSQSMPTIPTDIAAGSSRIGSRLSVSAATRATQICAMCRRRVLSCLRATERGRRYGLRDPHAAGADAIAPLLRRVVQQFDPDLPISYVRTQQQQIDADLQSERIF